MREKTVPFLMPFLTIALAAALLTHPGRRAGRPSRTTPMPPRTAMPGHEEEGQEGEKAEGQERRIYAGGAVPLRNSRSSAPIIQIVAMMMTMATNCSSTRSRISLCDVLGEPPRIMLMRPSTSTIATAPIAMGTIYCDMN